MTYLEESMRVFTTTIHNLDGGTRAISQISTMTFMNLIGKHLQPNKMHSFTIIWVKERNPETTSTRSIEEFYGCHLTLLASKTRFMSPMLYCAALVIEREQV